MIAPEYQENQRPERRSPFRSFWMAGYECADHLNKYGNRVDLLSATSHLTLLEQDYQDLAAFNISTVREGIRWSQVEYRPYHYDWTAVIQMMETGTRLGIQQLWDLCHFGFPDDLTPLHPKFSDRFVSLCESFVCMFRSIQPEGPILVTPINEVSFLSWLGGDAAGTSPFCVRQGWEVKYHLMRAYIAGIKAMRALDSQVVIISTEPLVHIIPPPEAGIQDLLNAAQQREDQFQSLDMLCGRICPELGGHPDLIDIVGVNFYFSNQWIHGTHERLSWAIHDRHPGWMPLNNLLEEVVARYQKPVLLSETSHPGEDRALWLSHIAQECAQVVEKDLPLWGICLYPIIDRPDWDYPDIWHRSGLWDHEPDASEGYGRTLCIPYARAIHEAQEVLKNAPSLSIPYTSAINFTDGYNTTLMAQDLL